uniref:Uncharacterized protein n=1 Tax=Oryza glumipatula TaxID=40148 RepID=A0A0E0BBU4_9ORYZ
MHTWYCGDVDIQSCSPPTLTLPPIHRQPANLYEPHQRQQQLGSSPFLLHLHARALPLRSSVPCTSCHPSICSAAAGSGWASVEQEDG